MIVTLADQYLAQNAGRRYPLADDTSGMPDNAILDFRCTVRGVPVGSVPSAVLTGITTTTVSSVTVRRMSVQVKYGATVVCTLTFDIPITVSANAPYVAQYVSDSASGEMTVTSAVVDASLVGTKSIPFSATTVTVDSLKVDSVQSSTSVDDDASHTKTVAVSGDVVLANGYNAEPYLDGNRIRLDVYKGAGTGQYCQQAASGQTCANVMFTLNGERPGSDGELKLVGESGIIVTPDPTNHAIEITLDKTASDKMAKKCAASC